MWFVEGTYYNRLNPLWTKVILHVVNSNDFVLLSSNAACSWGRIVMKYTPETVREEVTIYKKYRGISYHVHKCILKYSEHTHVTYHYKRYDSEEELLEELDAFIEWRSHLCKMTMIDVIQYLYDNTGSDKTWFNHCRDIYDREADLWRVINVGNREVDYLDSMDYTWSVKIKEGSIEIYKNPARVSSPEHIIKY